LQNAQNKKQFPDIEEWNRLKLLLTSNGFFTDEIKERFLELAGGETANRTAAIVTTASPLKENNPFAQKAKTDLIEMGVARVDFIDVEFENPEVLADKDIIYISGGNPFSLLHHAKRSGMDRVLTTMKARDVVVVGASAGSVVLGPDIRVVHFFTPHMDTYDTEEFTALYLTSRIIFPHYDREDLFPDPEHRTIEERLREFESRAGCVVTRLKDDGWIVDFPQNI
jgi:dipeptidase E